jgi:hypothetical protein
MIITPGLPNAGLSPKRVGKKRVAMSPRTAFAIKSPPVMCDRIAWSPARHTPTPNAIMSRAATRLSETTSDRVGKPAALNSLMDWDAKL